MALIDSLTGGTDTNAQADLQAALSAVQAEQIPTAANLNLSQLAQYGNTGNLTPAQMAAAQAGPSALSNENLSNAPISAQQLALSQEQAIAGSNGMTPQEQAQIAQAEQAVNENTAGQRGAIANQFAGQGVPQSLISAALQNGTVGQNAQQAYQNALQGQASASNNALTAMSNAGSLAGSMNQQQQTQANTVGAAQNALNQFNAANTQQANAANQATQQAANTYNTTNAQNIANQNVAGQQTVQEQNQVNAPQEAAGLQIQQAGQEAGIGEAQANQQTQVGQQTAGLIGAGIQGAGTAIAAAQGGMVPGYAQGDTVPPRVPATNFKRGGVVPGQSVSYNSPTRDTVPARLSPGELVVPNSVTHNPSALGQFLQQKGTPGLAAQVQPHHPTDIASVLKALQMMRGGS